MEETIIVKNKIPFALPILVVLIAISNLIACSSDEPNEQQKVLEEAGLVEAVRTSPEAAAKAAFNIWAKNKGTPYQNESYVTVSNDNTFATVNVIAEFRETAEADWLEKESYIECKKVGDEWQCDQIFSFQLTDAQQAKMQAKEKALKEKAVEQSDTSQSAEPSSDEPSNWKLYVTELVIGKTAEESFPAIFEGDYQPEVKDGWQMVIVKFVLENTNSELERVPIPKRGSSGVIIDQGGYERPLTIDYAPHYTQGVGKSHLIDYGIILDPKMQMAGAAYTSVPENQNPDVLILLFDHDQDNKIDEAVTTSITQPFEPSQPSEFFHHFNPKYPPQLYDFPGEMSVAITTAEIEQTSNGGTRVKLGVEIENTGGYNISPNLNKIIRIHGIDTARNYFTGISEEGGDFKKNQGKNELAPGEVAMGWIASDEFNQNFSDTEKALVVISITDSENSIYYFERLLALPSQLGQIVDDDFGEQVVQAFQAAKTFKCAFNGKTYTEGSEVEDDIWEVQLVRPSKFSEKSTYKDKNNSLTFEDIYVDDKHCHRENEADWNCEDINDNRVEEFDNYWSNIVKGKPNDPNSIIVDLNITNDLKIGRQCRLYSWVEVQTQSDSQQEMKYEACFDLDTKFPLTFRFEVSERVTEMTGQCFDLNKPVEITIPEP
ncbi:MAG: hypothetical protein KDI79_19575 [Anaerolineae bacterium]|nr:hypothetical protein [Anaerolineae bacterium]